MWADDLHIELHRRAVLGIAPPPALWEQPLLALEGVPPYVVREPPPIAVEGVVLALLREESQTRDADLLLGDTQELGQHLNRPHVVGIPEIHRRPVTEVVHLHADLMRLGDPVQRVAVHPAHRHLSQLPHVLLLLLLLIPKKLLVRNLISVVVEIHVLIWLLIVHRLKYFGRGVGHLVGVMLLCGI